MATEETRKLAQRYLDTLNRVLSTGNLDLLDNIATADFIEHGAGVGLDSWKKNVAASRSAFPDSQLTANAILADGDKAAIHATLRGTNLGELYGMPPTGKAISIDFIDIVRFQNGLAAERWMIADAMGMMTQLGVMPEPGS